MSPCFNPLTGSALSLVPASSNKDSKDRLNSRIKSYPAFDSESIYLIDPYGNLMMQYKKGTNPSGIIKDIERLIRISK